MARTLGANHMPMSRTVCPRQQLRQLGDVGGDGRTKTLSGHLVTPLPIKIMEK